ncbi:CheR family methyltransferase [Aminipila sp.]|jgi:chemotaxis protein methyltransferase CheR|uniref:CheR family methyltransferase n=2 Tax=Aminipila sp. TaxID=2060095 RepID=UPI001DCB9CF4|nr:protein-glutamate O-methyltransferase CheR [Aminipila sp.]MBE6033240.1 protein-glutamate O-methyltransferase CheR [Clostridiales bacterium]
MLTISQKDFIRLTEFIIKNYGINLKAKKVLIEGRLSNYLTAEGYGSFTEYVDHIVSTKNNSDIEMMLNKLTTNHTFFMREENHFTFFNDTILPYLESTKTNHSISIWSAGCSSGEEPYTLSIIMKEYFKSNAITWDTRLLATDISQNALNKASKGFYAEDSLKALPEIWKRSYFTQKDGGYQVTDQLRKNVIFRTFNLMEPIQFKTKFDVIFCRNVMIYFDKPTKAALIQRYYNALNPGGYLLIGHSETIDREESEFQYIMPATYRKPL